MEIRGGIVTGAGGAIGRAIAVKLALKGFSVLVDDIEREKVIDTVKEIQNLGGTASGCFSNVLDKVEVTRMVDQAIREFNGIYFLVNVVGGARNSRITEISEKEWDDVIDLNLKTAFLCSQAVIKTMIQQRSGRIVNISSFAKDGVHWFAPLNISRVHYSAANAGLVGLTHALAIELGEFGITANCVVPGPCKIPRNEAMWQSIETDPKVEVKPLSLIPLKRYCSPDDVADAVSFLISGDASYITGAEMYVTGGL